MSQTPPLILIVDDNATNLDLLVTTLQDDYRLGIAKKGTAALDYAAAYRPDLILLDIMMPEMDGYEVCSRLKSQPETAGIPVIFISAMNETDDKTRGFALGAVDYITKPFHAAEVKARVKTHVTLQAMKAGLRRENESLEKKVAEKTGEIREILNGTIQSMALMVEIRDPYTAGHQQRVARLACAIARRMGIADGVIEGIHIAGVLHDVGKIRIPVSILSRTGRLLDAEMEVIKIHPQIGFEILKNIPFPWPCAQMVYQHHERLDGSGYPLGLRGDAILLESRILSVADVAEAESSFRPYRPAKGIEAALAELREHRGRRYDSDIVDTAVSLLDSGDFQFDDSEQKRSPLLCVPSAQAIGTSL